MALSTSSAGWSSNRAEAGGESPRLSPDETSTAPGLDSRTRETSQASVTAPGSVTAPVAGSVVRSM